MGDNNFGRWPDDFCNLVETMSEQKHTQEPWSVYNRKEIHGVLDREGSHLAEMWHRAKYNSLANAERIVACVNACAGMDDPAKEIDRMKARAEAAETKNFNLLEQNRIMREALLIYNKCNKKEQNRIMRGALLIFNKCNNKNEVVKVIVELYEEALAKVKDLEK